jgi:aminopeptidase N
MTWRVAILAVLAWGLIGEACAGAGPANDFDVLAYDISLRPDFATKTIHGEETISFKSLVERLGAISFTGSAAAITSVTFQEGRPVETAIEGERRVFHLPEPMSAGQVGSVTIQFDSTPKGAVFGDDTVYVNYFTCHVIVCEQDRTSDKATIDLQLDLPSGMQAVGPGRLTRFADRSGRAVWHWHESRPTSPYLIGFAAGAFQQVHLPGNGPKLIVLSEGAAPDRVRAMFADTRRMLRFFEQKSGVRYDAPTYTQVLVDGDEAQEAARHSIIGKDELEPILKDPQEDWVIAHELAHQWWGNSLTCADWSELWLNEGLTVFMVAAYKELRWGRAAYDREIDLANKRWASAKEQGFDVPLSWKGEYPSLKLKRAMAYAKAVVFFDNLRTELGEKTFWQAIKAYTQHHKNGVVTAKDVQRAFEQTSGRNLATTFDEWVFGTPAP